MEENKSKEVGFKDITKHYLSSLAIYGFILAIIGICPVYTDFAQDEGFDYLFFFIIYYLLYMVFAPVIFYTVKPKTILRSKSVAIMNYFKRQFAKTSSTAEFLNNIAPRENEAQAFMIIFAKAFFGIASVMILCTKYYPSLGYNLDFLKVMFDQALIYIGGTGAVNGGISQYILDTGDMWIKIMFTITTTVFAFSCLTELSIFKNKIKYVDTTPLGVLSSAVCYYPLIILTDKFINVTQDALMPVENQTILVILTLLAVFVNFVSMIAILRLGTKSGNLTNRGIVTGFPYNIIRHPDYAAQIGYIIVTTIPLYLLASVSTSDKIYITICTVVWIYIYYLRAVTEERNLIKDDKYKQYVEKVKYRFIPKLF